LNDLSRLLEAVHRGDQQAAELLPLVNAELRKLAAVKLANEKPGQTLDATALVHEAYIRLVGTPVAHASGSSPRFDGRGHFFAAAAEAMRRILVEQARRRRSLKRGGGAEREQIEPDQIASPTPDDELLALNDALDTFAQQHPEKAELVKLRYFAGLTADQAAEVLGLSASTADRHWAYARAWLKRAMG
jgi:RNA polymerase sigma factor (TIGR02999 family)